MVDSWCFRFLMTIATLTLLVRVSSAKTSGSCPAVSPETDELRVKVDDLERQLYQTRKEAGDLRSKVDELKADAQKQTGELSRYAEERAEQEKREKRCKEEVSNLLNRLVGSNKENRLNRKAVSLCEALKEKAEDDLKTLTAELEQVRSGACAGNAAPTGEDAESLKEQLVNCDETVKAVRERCDRESKDLKRIEKTHDRIRKNLDNCTDKLRTCEADKDHLNFLKRGYDVVVQQLEKESKEAKDDKERSEANAKEAIKGASKYQFYLVAIGVLALTGGTIKGYSIAKAKMAERLATLAAAKHKDKQDAKKKGATPSKTKKLT